MAAAIGDIPKLNDEDKLKLTLVQFLDTLMQDDYSIIFDRYNLRFILLYIKFYLEEIETKNKLSDKMVKLLTMINALFDTSNEDKIVDYNDDFLKLKEGVKPLTTRSDNILFDINDKLVFNGNADVKVLFTYLNSFIDEICPKYADSPISKEEYPQYPKILIHIKHIYPEYKYRFLMANSKSTFGNAFIRYYTAILKSHKSILFEGEDLKTQVESKFNLKINAIKQVESKFDVKSARANSTTGGSRKHRTMRNKRNSKTKKRNHNRNRNRK